jgi:hypothetical protein
MHNIPPPKTAQMLKSACDGGCSERANLCRRLLENRVYFLWQMQAGNRPRGFLKALQLFLHAYSQRNPSLNLLYL